MTTDTRPKEAAVRVEIGDGRASQSYVVAGMAKGAGMIHPNMATMLCLVVTDAAHGPATLAQRALRDAADVSFNMITVDGDMSTNDTGPVAGSPERPGQAWVGPRRSSTARITEAYPRVSARPDGGGHRLGPGAGPRWRGGDAFCGDQGQRGADSGRGQAGGHVGGDIVAGQDGHLWPRRQLGAHHVRRGL